MVAKRKTVKRTRPKPYTAGEVNRIIDAFAHPFFKFSSSFILFDEFLHAMVEQNPPVSIKKFVRYGLPELEKHARKKRKKTK